MCGIVYSKSFVNEPVHMTVLKRFKAQRNRGINGFGFYVPEKNLLAHHTCENKILKMLSREKTAAEILFHHRFPTSTDNVRNSCHPFSTKKHFDNNYIVVHNGVVSNARELKVAHEKLGIKYISTDEKGRFNDSEALTYDIAMYLEGKQDAIKARGSIAFIAIRRDVSGKATMMFFGRNSNSPLVMRRTEKSMTLSSLGKGDVVEIDTLYALNYDTLELTKRKCEIPGGYKPYPYNSYTPKHTPTPTVRQLSLEEESRWEDDYDDRWMKNSTIKSIKEEVLFKADYDTLKAIKLANDMRKSLEEDLMRIDALALDEEEESKVTPEMIGEYCVKEDQLTYVQMAIAQLREEYKAEDKGVPMASCQMGFRGTNQQTLLGPVAFPYAD